ncbi:class F sortase [Kitasatospora sp. MMS16-BH015]|uniref:class F sortase n=1 Tax=Kitasatospora sp. MMS16-BH015 TaxID=2018025 RepID=UPI0020C5257C|nr:class F sortase [Kitasatospora sp. MMS16-BH015]
MSTATAEAPLPHRLTAGQTVASAGHAPVPAPVAGAGDAAARSEPLRIRIPAIEVDAPLTALGLDATGALQVPSSRERNLAGWYGAGVSPGERGTAVVTGHVDTEQGPAVFFRLAELTAGQLIAVSRRDGHDAVFAVDTVEGLPKAGFPSTRVYASAARPELRLITCGGRYDPAAGGYQDNTVVYAHLIHAG